MLPETRQLAAIMFTDIEGYTAVMQQDEKKALAFKDRHREIIQREHEKFNGRVIQYYGDGTLSIFQSVVQAVQCALTMQQIFCGEPCIPMRMGVHVGDIIINDGHIFGDGVNLASRIESLSVVGCVLISDKVNDELHNHPEFKTLSMGAFKFKNIEREVEVFAIDHQGLVKPLPNSLKGKTEEKNPRSLPSAIPKKSIAVLPFVNMSNDPEQEYFSDGMAEEILNSLSHLKDLKVAGRTSSFQFKGKNIDLRVLGQKLGVNTVLEGSVRKQANRLRVTAQLINVEDGFHLWSEKFDRDMDDIFAIQDEIAMAITEKLKITLRETERAIITTTSTENKEAYDLYLKGRFYWNRRGPGLKKALEYFVMAAKLDPEFSLAHAGIADTYALFGFYSFLPPHEVVPKARKAAERAIQLNPARVEPYSVLAYLTTFYDWNWIEAKKQFQKAITVNPGYAPAHYWYSNYLSWIEKDYRHSEKEALEAIEVEPLISHSHITLSSAYLCSEEFEKSRKSSQAAIELDANSFLSYSSLCMALYGLGKYEEAIAAIKFAVKISGRHQYPLFQLAWLYSMIGNLEGSQKILDELIIRSKTEFISGLSLAIAAYYSKNYDKAYDFLEQAFEERASLLPSISGYPFFSFLKDPRFQPFVKRMNFPA
ncbi:MAG TPA: adenylate/guanylate cyclase domain-containing protein [Chitinophagaceae bacterium]|nr:adenylate/guanylate cyclase domain-containing protein [Chitinophagaceae bacterium]